MEYVTITRACGHKETICVSSARVLDNETTRKAHEAELCEDCYLKNNRDHVRECRMSYDRYKNKYGQYRTKANSYDEETREIVVFVPNNISCDLS